MTPNKASKKENEEKVFTNLYGDLIYSKPKKQNFAIGDKVRISKYKRQHLIKVTRQTGQKRYFWLIKFYQQNLLLIKFLIRWVK